MPLLVEARRSAIPAVLVLAVAFARATHGQTIGDLREELRASLGGAHFAGAFSGLILISDEIELSGAGYSVDDEVGTKLSTLTLPFHTTSSPWGEGAPGLYVEGAAGYGRASQHAGDIYAGELPGLETAVDAHWKVYGALFGLGPALRIAGGLTFAPVANFGIARVVSDADYAGPGTALSAALLDGIALNWDAWVLSGGGAARLDWSRPLGRRHRLEVIGRYDVRWSSTVATADRAQAYSNRLQLLKFRADLGGPSGLRVFGLPLGWRAMAGYRHFLEGSLLDVRDLVDLGASLELDIGETVPIIRTVTFNGRVTFGAIVRGWGLGVGASF